MQYVVLYISTAVVFLGADAIMLRSIMKPLFDRHIGDWLLTDIRLGAAAVFYLFYVAGLVALVSAPALREGQPGQALIWGAVVGAMAYGTYEFTNYATLKLWSLQQVAVDLTWGTVLTGVSAWAGVMIARALT